MRAYRNLAVALGAILLASCNAAVKVDRARKEVGLQAEVLMRNNDVPRDQAHFDELTRVAGCPADPWSAPYVYERLGIREIRISSKGPDGELGNADDVAETFTFPAGSGLEDWRVLRADGTEAILSPDGARTFWVTQRDAGGSQITDYWVGDGAGTAAKPIRTATVDTERYRRGVTLKRWSKDGKYVTVRELDGPIRPDGKAREALVTLEVPAGKEVDAATLPADLEWQDY